MKKKTLEQKESLNKSSKVYISVDNILEMVYCVQDCDLSEKEAENYVKAFLFDLTMSETESFEDIEKRAKNES